VKVGEAMGRVLGLGARHSLVTARNLVGKLGAGLAERTLLLFGRGVRGAGCAGE